jgi:hypothetical protein
MTRAAILSDNIHTTPMTVVWCKPFAGGNDLIVTVNTPPPERRWLQITAESRIGPPAADSRQIEVITSSSIAVQLFMISAEGCIAHQLEH